MQAPYPTLAPEGFERRHVAFWFTLLTVLAGIVAYVTMMTEFQPYDDEGALMISVKQYLEGMQLYSQVFSCYGPVYYFYQWALRTVTATPVTHDVVRISSLLPWLVTALVAGWITLRLTRSLILACMAHLMASLLLAFFRWEPGHPQELAVLLFAALAAAPLTAGIEKRRTFLMLALGALAAALCLVKANAGVFASAALAMTFAACGQRTPAWRAIAVTIAVACTVLPFVLMRNHLDAQWARSYCWVEVAAVAGCVANMLRLRRVPLITRGDCIQAAAGFASTVTAIVAVLKMQGVPVFAVYDSLLVAPARIFLEHRTWFHAPDLMKLTSVWAAVGLSVALFSAWKQPLRGTAVWNTLFAGKLLFCVIAIAAALTRRPLLPVVAPFVWLLLFNPSQTDDESQSFPRGMLAILTVLQALYAYPVAGNQYHLIQVLIWVAVVVCVGDTLSWFADYWRLREKSMRWGRAAATSALVMVALLHVRVGLGRYQTYQELSPLDLPGARLLRVDNETRENFKLLVSNLKQHCDSLESYPGLRSLNFWSGLNPVTGLNIDNWAQSFSAEQEQKVVAALSMHPHACVVYDLRLAEFWNPGQENLDHHPLVGYIFRNFQPVSESGDYQLMMRKDRIRTAASSPAPSLGPVYSR